MVETIRKPPVKAWVTTYAGMTINLCLGILYAWSIWKKALVNVDLAGQPMAGINVGWTYLTNAQAATPFSLCVMVFAIMMIPGGRIQDKYSPRIGALAGGVLLALGCIIAGLMKSYLGLILGFGIVGGIGMGLGYAAPTPAALKWFGHKRRGLVAGIVVSGYGGAAIYIGVFGQLLIDHYGITGSFVALGVFFALVVIVTSRLLYTPPEGYVPPTPVKAATKGNSKSAERKDWTAFEMMKTWQFYALVFMFILNTQSGLLIIANAAGLLKDAGKGIPFLMANAWILVSYGGLVNASGRICTGWYSDKLGRQNAYFVNCLISAVCLFSLPYVISTKNIILLFIVVGIAYWQYGGGLSLLPSFAVDFYGEKNLGLNYGLIFLGWGLGFFMARLGGTIEDMTGSLNYAFYISGGLLLMGAILSRIVKRPKSG
ncbi:MAG: OFA family MFS transporter [Proteobacteria bacterium]|nr:OFA family MFS transporter [Pseudomonadota bacterium]